MLLGLALGSRESYDSWLSFGRDLIDRGLRAPALVVADGAPGLWKAARELWPAANEQRCTVHALRQVTAKLPERHHREVKARWWRVFDETASPSEARRELLGLAGDYRGAYPSAAAVIERDVDALIAHLRFPPEHRKRIRSTNLLERTFVEVRRRTKVIGRFPGRDLGAVAYLGGARALEPQLARSRHDAEDGGRDRAAAAWRRWRGYRGASRRGRRLG